METSRNRLVTAPLLLAIMCSGVSLVTLPRDASAQHRAHAKHARLSSDLRRRIENGDLRNENVILTATPDRIRRIAARHGLRVKKWLDTGAVFDVPSTSIVDLTEDAEVDLLATNLTVRANLAVTNEAIGADLVHEGTWREDGRRGRPFDGHGVGIALIDSGVAVMPQLSGRVIARLDFTNSRGVGLDGYGHGTHIAGIIASRDRGDAKGGAKGNSVWRGEGGVAPGAHIVSLKVLDSNGIGTADNVIEAIDWTIRNAKRFRIKVINLSLGGPVLQAAADDPLCQAVERAYKAGLVVVASAGNFGKTADGKKIFGGITTPGISAFAITVGALNTKGTPEPEDDEVASYSSRGPTLFERLIKPDFVAPGNRIQSLAAPGSTLVKKYPELVIGRGYTATLTLSGTSMAAGVASGAVAIVLNAHPSSAPVTIKTALQLSAHDLDAGLLFAGAGSISIPSTLLLGQHAHRGVAFTSRSQFADAVLSGVLVNDQSSSAGRGRRPASWGPHDTIIWDSFLDETIIWGSDFDDQTIIWGSDFDDQTIIWGADFDDQTIIWGSDFDDQTIIWGSDFDDQTIIWGSDFDETIIWGANLLVGD